MVVGGGAALVAVIGIAALAFGDGGRGCMTGLVDHLPADAEVVQGSDLGRAREAGYDDGGGLEQLADSTLATGVIPDPLTNQNLTMYTPPSENTGYEPGDVDCWLGPLEPSFVARGSFDADRVAQSESGEQGTIELDGGLLAYGSEGAPGDLLVTRDQPDSMRRLVEAFDRQDAVSFSATSAGDDSSEGWTGVGLARGDGWEMLAVWSLPDGEAADAAETDIRAALADDSHLGELIDGDPADLLERDGATLWLRGPLSGEPRTWLDPFRYLDPALMVFSDLDLGD